MLLLAFAGSAHAGETVRVVIEFGGEKTKTFEKIAWREGLTALDAMKQAKKGEGGISVNTVPDACTIEIDRRVIPGEDGLQVMAQLEAFLRERIDVDFEMLPPWLVGTTLNDDKNGQWADKLIEQIEPVAGPRRKLGVAYGTNASRIDNAGVPAVVFGPGSIDQAHTRDEWLSIDELRQAAEVYYRFCASVG